MTMRSSLSLLAISLAPLAQAQEVLPEIAKRFAPGAAAAETPNFQRHVVTLLGRLGCNGRNCHGSFQGRGGFRLSMFGYDFDADHAALTTGKRPKIDKDDPSESLMLTKPTDKDNHGGGERFKKDGWEYRVLQKWIASGAKQDSAKAGRLTRLEVLPREMVMDKLGQEAQLQVIAHWADGTREDVTCLTRFSSNDDGVAKVSESGRVTFVGKGATYIISSYDSGVESNLAILPVTPLAGGRYPDTKPATAVDAKIAGQLKKLGILPSELCTDEEFLRRAMLDITGTLPTPEQVLAFLADKASDRRARLVDRLLESPEYAAWWTTFLCDLTGLNAPLFLGNTEWAKVTGDQWQNWIHRRVRDNVGYDKIARGLILAVSRKPGQSYAEYAAEMSLYTRKKAPLDYSDREFMDHFWHRGNVGMADEKALSFAHIFLGVRLDCAQCHKHPFDQWSQQDFKQFTAFFNRIQRGIAPESAEAHDKLQQELGNPIKMPAAERRAFYKKISEEGRPAPWREVYIAAVDAKLKKKIAAKDPDAQPRILGGDVVEVKDDEHPLAPLTEWLLRRDNPYFARAFVNRVWAQYFGRGIVDAVDDFNLGNPPSNKELLDYLASGFIDHGYDMKWLHREIANSHAYQRSWLPNETNAGDERHFSRAVLRRLPAEVALDALTIATLGTKSRALYLKKLADRRIAQQPTADLKRTEFGLAVFGKPLRITNCDCERQMDPSLLQAIFLRNDKDIVALLERTDGWIKEVTGKHEPESLVREAYLRSLSRLPTAAERERSIAHVKAASSLQEGVRDLLWALLNTKEFITNH
jgi:hypothetical protein